MITFQKEDRQQRNSNYDVIVSKHNDLLKWLEIAKFPKLDGTNWRVQSHGETIEQALELNKLDTPKHLELEVNLTKDVYIKFIQTTGLSEIKKKTRKEIFNEVLYEYTDIVFSTTAKKELLNLFTYDVQDLRNTIDEIIEMYPGVYKIEPRHVSAVRVAQNKVYARDVILALLLYNNPHVPKKGTLLSTYKWKKWDRLLTQLQESIGVHAAHYALRNAAKSLYQIKLKFLDNVTINRDLDLMRVVDVYELLYLYTKLNTSNELQTYAALLQTEMRRE